MITIVIPAFNEEARIGRTLEHYLNFFRDNVKFLVVLNGCTDGTERIVKEYAQRFPGKLSIRNLAVGAKGAALKEGFLHAEGELVGFVDGDESTAPEEFAKLIDAIDGVDGVIASRWMPGSVVKNRGGFRKVMSPGFVAVQKILFGLPYRDTQCGAKIFRKKVTDTIAPMLRVANMAIDVEILWLAKKNGFRIKEVPTVWVDRMSSTIPLSPIKAIWSSLKILKTLVALRLRFIFS